MYWYIALLARPPMRRSCDGLEERRSHRQTVQFRTQAIDDLGGADVAFRERFERNVEEAGIGRATPPPVNTITFATAGSLLITLPICWMESFIACKG